MFPQWLRDQASRPDDVGRYAALVTSDRQFPNTNRLYALLRYCGEHSELRRLTKKAHGEWRQTRRKPC